MEQGGEPSVLLILAIVIVAFPMAFAALWSFVIWLMSVIGGWRDVADRFPAGGRPSGGRSFSGVNAMFGVASYSHLLTAVVGDGGLYLETPRFFRIGHKPIFIPWSAFRNIRTHTVLGWRYVSFDVGSPRIARVRLPAHVLRGAPIESGQAPLAG